MWIWAAVVIAVTGVVAALFSPRIGQVPPLVDDRPVPDLPDGPLRGEDLTSARFAVVPRGYSMDQVDALLARLARQIDAGAASEDDRSPRRAGAIGTEDAVDTE